MKPTELKKVRASLNMTRAEFAKAMGVSIATVYNWETGKAKFDKHVGALESLRNKQLALTEGAQVALATVAQSEAKGLRLDRELAEMADLSSRLANLSTPAKLYLHARLSSDLTHA